VPPRERPVIRPGELRNLIEAAVDFGRVNSGSVRIVLGAVNLATGAETYFDNDRHVLGPDHVFGQHRVAWAAAHPHRRSTLWRSAVSVAALDDARPADTLCLVVDGYDPIPGVAAGQPIGARDRALRRNHDLRRMIALLGERVPPGLRGDTDVKKCLAEASEATMTILHLCMR